MSSLRRRRLGTAVPTHKLFLTFVHLVCGLDAVESLVRTVTERRGPVGESAASGKGSRRLPAGGGKVCAAFDGIGGGCRRHIQIERNLSIFKLRTSFRLFDNIYYAVSSRLPRLTYSKTSGISIPRNSFFADIPVSVAGFVRVSLIAGSSSLSGKIVKCPSVDVER